MTKLTSMRLNCLMFKVPVFLMGLTCLRQLETFVKIGQAKISGTGVFGTGRNVHAQRYITAPPCSQRGRVHSAREMLAAVDSWISFRPFW